MHRKRITRAYNFYFIPTPSPNPSAVNVYRSSCPSLALFLSPHPPAFPRWTFVRSFFRIEFSLRQKCLSIAWTFPLIKGNGYPRISTYNICSIVVHIKCIIFLITIKYIEYILYTLFENIVLIIKVFIQGLSRHQTIFLRHHSKMVYERIKKKIHRSGSIFISFIYMY